MVIRPARSGRGLVARLAIAALTGLPLVGPSTGHAQVAPRISPDANENESRRQLERLERQQQLPRARGPAVIGPARQTSPFLKPGGPKFLLKGVRFEASKFLAAEELNAIAAQYVGRKIDFSDLKKLLAAINELYAGKGIVTGLATVPPQTLDNGIVQIRLTEGRLDKLSVTGAAQTNPDYVLDRVRQPGGEVLDVPKLNRDVTWFNRTNDTQIRALLQPGAGFGLTDVQMAVTEAPAHVVQLFTDNQGVASTGRYQAGTYYRRSGLLGVDDRFTVYGTKSQGSLNANLSYNIPVNIWGGRLGASYSVGQTRVIDGPLVPLDIHGASHLYGLNFSQPLWADESWLVLANFAGTNGISRTRAADVDLTYDRTNKGTAGISVSHFGPQHVVTLSPNVNYVDSHSYVVETHRHFETWSGTASGLLKLPPVFSASLFGSGQYTQERLVPGDQLFQIGGPTTVRGYPTNAVAGDSGYYLNIELHADLSSLVKGLDLYGFFDRGEVFSTFPPRRILDSAGGGLSLLLFSGFTLEASIGAPLDTVVPGQRRYEAYYRASFRPLSFDMRASAN